MKNKSKTTSPGETKKTNETILTFEDLVKSNLCMMYFARGCSAKRYSRGLCSKHYHTIRSLCITGVVTWEKVEKQLKALPIKDRESREDLIKELTK